MPIFIPRDLFNDFQADAIDQQAKLVKEDLQRDRTPIDPGGGFEVPRSEPPPQPEPAPQPEPTPSAPSPPPLENLLAMAGLAPPSGGPAAPSSATAGAAPTSSIPSLDSLMQQAGLGDVASTVGGAIRGAAQTVAPAAPPPLQNLMRSAGLLEQPNAQAAAPGTPPQTQPGLMDRIQAQLGRPYVWGGKDAQAGFDCSGFAGYLTTGQPESTTTLYGKSAPVQQQDLQVGDLVFYNMGQSDMTKQHVGVYIGNGKLAQAGGAERTVNIADINQQIGSPPEFRRLNAGVSQAAAGAPAQAAGGGAQSATQTTAGLSGGGDLAGQIGEKGQQILSGAAGIASWLGDQGQKALQAVLVTEGGLAGARGDEGKSAGPLQFFEGGQLANFARQMGQTLEQAKQYVEEHPLEAIRWAIGTAQNPGYLGAAIAEGIAKGLTGADLATYAQRHGQVSVSPERAGQNYDAMFGSDQGAVARMGTSDSGAAGGYNALAARGTDLVNQGATLTQGLTPNLGESPELRIQREADERVAQLQEQTGSTLQAAQAEQTQRSVAASQQASEDKPLWQKLGEGIMSGLQQAFGGPAAPTPQGLIANAVQPTVQSAGGAAASAIAESPPGQAVGAGVGAVRRGFETATGTAAAGGGVFPTGGPAAGPIVGAERFNTGEEQLLRENGIDPEQIYQARQRASRAYLETGQPGQLTSDERALEQRANDIIRQGGGMDVTAMIPGLGGDNEVLRAAQRNPDIEQREEGARTAQAVVAAPLTLASLEATIPSIAANAAAIGIDPGNIVGLPLQSLHLINQAGEVARRARGGGRAANIVERTGTDVRPGLAAAGELGTLSPREELPNVAIWERTPGARYIAGDESGYHPPPITQAQLLPGTENLPQQQKVRQVIADLVPNERIPRDLKDDQANAFADAMRANGASVATGDWTPEQTALSALITRFSQGRGQVPAMRLNEALGDEWMLRELPSLQTQGATAGPGAAAYGLVIRPETLAAHLAGDTANPDMMEFLVALSRPDAFPTPQARADAIQRGVDEFYRLARLAGYGDRGDPPLITGGPIVRQGVAMQPTARRSWSEVLPELHRTIQEWGTGTGRYAGLNEAQTKAQLLEDIQNAGVAGIGLDKAPFVANMGFSPEYGVLDLRMRRQVFGLSPKAQITRAERDLLEQKLADAFPNANSNYVAQWLPWAYLTDEKTDYTSIAGAYQRLGAFMRRAEQVAQESGRPLGEVARDLAEQTPRVPIDYPQTAEEVVARIGISPAVVKRLEPGTTGEALRKAAPELEAFRKQAGVEFVEKPSVGVGYGISPEGIPVREPDADLLLRGSVPSNRYFAAAWLAANPAEDSVMIAHLGASGSADSVATLALEGVSQDRIARLHELVTQFSPDGWHTKVRLDRKGAQETTHVVIGGVGRTMDEFEPEIRGLVQDLRDAHYNVTSSYVEPARIEFLGQADVQGVLHGGPRGAARAEAAGATAGEAGRTAAPSAGRALGAGTAERPGAGANASVLRDVAGGLRERAVDALSGSAPRSIAADIIPSQIPGRRARIRAIDRIGARAARERGIDLTAPSAPPSLTGERFYHGTASEFGRPDAAKFEPDGLFGPGYYLTDDPRVAGGIVGPGKSELQRQIDQLEEIASDPTLSERRRFVTEQHIEELRREIAKTPANILSSGYAQQRAPITSQARLQEIAAWEELLAQRRREGADPTAIASAERYLEELRSGIPTAGPNVRVVNVPRNMRLFDVEGSVPEELQNAWRREMGPAAPSIYGRETGDEFYQGLHEELGSTTEANKWLRDHGYDGIRYAGGQRIPMRDEVGTPIEHTAVVVFPESIDKLTNATARTPGGFLPGTAETGMDARGAAGRAAVGGIGAAEQEREREGSTPESIAQAAVGGAALGAGRSLVGRALPGLRISAQLSRVAAAIGGQPGSARSFDLEKLAELRAQYQANQPPLVQAPAKVGKLDRFIGYTAANMLSGIGTAVQNTVGNFGQMLTRPVITAAAGYPVDAMRDVAAMSASLSDAFAAYGRTFKSGQRASQQTLQAPLLTGKASILSVPMRNLAATDEFYRTLNSAGAAAAEASRRLRENPTLTFDQVLQKHTQDIADAAADGAARGVYEKGGGLAGWFGEWVAQKRSAMLDSKDNRERAMGAILQWLMPMTRVPGVILGEGVRGLPVANELRGLQRTVELARQGDTVAARKEFARTYLTTFVNFAILSEVAQGNITGDGPTNPSDRQRLMEAVDENGNAIWRPNSIRVGGKWIDYSGLGPLALPMSSIANLVDEALDRAQKPPEQRGGVPDIALNLLNREARTIGNAWYLKGLADVLSGIKEGTLGGTGSSLTQVADRLVPAESLLNEFRRVEDMYAREPTNVLEREASRIPFASRLVEPRLSATTGRPVEQPRDWFSTLVRGTPSGMMTPNPVAAEVSRLDESGNRVSVPYEVKTYKGAKQTDDQERLIHEQVGTAVNMYVLDTMNKPQYARLSDAQKADALRSAIGQAQAAADITLGGQVARSPHESALLQWSQKSHYYDMPRGTPDEVARKNWEIDQAYAKLRDYRRQFGEQGDDRFEREDPKAYNLTRRYQLRPKEELDAMKASIDKATGGALSQKAKQAETGGLVGVGSTTLPPRPPRP